MSVIPAPSLRTRFLTIILALQVAGCALRTVPMQSVPALNAVQPLQARLYDSTTGEWGDRTFCTAFSINEAKHLWATAGHCLKPDDDDMVPSVMVIQGHPVHTVYLDASADLGIVSGEDISAPALPLGTQVPRVYSTLRLTNDYIETRGFPYGLPMLVVTQGTMAAHYLFLEHPQFPMPIPCDILDVTGAPGNSGSPVLLAGYVVGVVWGGFTHSAHMIAVPLEEVTRALGPYWEH